MNRVHALPPARPGSCRVVSCRACMCLVISSILLFSQATKLIVRKYIKCSNMPLVFNVGLNITCGNQGMGSQARPIEYWAA